VSLYEAVILGAGPAGLTAATYLARFRRRVVVLGAGPPRASWIPESHNTPGFPHGVGGPELLKRLTDQATQFGVEIREARANTLARDEEVFRALSEKMTVVLQAWTLMRDEERAVEAAGVRR